ncbi:hypothetical protein GQX74_002373 [Glossina fuscipes]|nr:hypothetical protein GQX74_002373 [Glossina fuscipes]
MNNRTDTKAKLYANLSNRKSTKSLAVKDVSPLRNTPTVPANKYELSSSPQIGYKLEVPVRAIVGEATTNKWFWNDMMKENREHFNNLHFC